jgi:hypothetical protein
MKGLSAARGTTPQNFPMEYEIRVSLAVGWRVSETLPLMRRYARWPLPSRRFQGTLPSVLRATRTSSMEGLYPAPLR